MLGCKYQNRWLKATEISIGSQDCFIHVFEPFTAVAYIPGVTIAPIYYMLVFCCSKLIPAIYETPRSKWSVFITLRH